ncbi:unnamed protein product [Miscanthus lutarioriparius]|uniref:Uncharacterized protein n=1 Tax=Miscanthus lutarioriparius TaxID=422564 RepID=A0A811R6S6_9POAL|nr:unnamed protein product [Miscanthus lutarioriparius]CAD6265772.1 unnamed protein product [Miscanthus lutarioriparius]
MEHQLLDALCECMTYFLCAEGTYIIHDHEGDPVKVMLFIVHRKLESSTKDGGRMGFFNSIILNPDDFCGEELVTWALLPSLGDSYPSSTRTMKTITELEAFSLQADDLNEVCGQHIQDDAFQAPEAHILVLLAPEENMGSLSHPVSMEAVPKSTEDGRKRHE